MEIIQMENHNLEDGTVVDPASGEDGKAKINLTKSNMAEFPRKWSFQCVTLSSFSFQIVLVTEKDQALNYLVQVFYFIGATWNIIVHASKFAHQLILLFQNIYRPKLCDVTRHSVKILCSGCIFYGDLDFRALLVLVIDLVNM